MVRQKKDEGSKVIPGDGADNATTPENPPANTPKPGDDTPPVNPPNPEPSDAEEMITLSKKELEGRLNSVRSDLGRQLKSALQVNAELKSRFDSMGLRMKDMETEVSKARQRERDAELKRSEGNTEAIELIKLKHQNEDMALEIARKRSEFDSEKAQWQTKIEAMAKTEATTLAKELAQASGLTAELILDIGSDTVDGKTTYNLDRMRAIAAKHPKTGEEEEEQEGEEPEGETQNPPQTKGLKSKAGGAMGGGRRGLTTMKDYDEAFAHGEISYEEYQKARQRFQVS